MPLRLPPVLNTIRPPSPPTKIKASVSMKSNIYVFEKGLQALVGIGALKLPVGPCTVILWVAVSAQPGTVETTKLTLYTPGTKNGLAGGFLTGDLTPLPKFHE